MSADRTCCSLFAAFLAVTTVAILMPRSLGAQEKDGPRDNPRARQEWFMRGRQSPDARPAAEHLRRAFEQRRAVRFAARRGATVKASARPGMTGFGGATGGGTWTELGPRPLNTSGSTFRAGGPPEQDYGAVSGRVTAIAIDPSDPTGNTVYVGAAFGGLWKSTNALSTSPTFTPLTDSALTLSVGAIGLDTSTSPTTIFIGTGEPNGGDSYYGEGILESADAGKSWNPVQAATDAGQQVSLVGMGFFRILFDQQNSSIVLAGATGVERSYTGTVAVLPGPGGIYRSADHGKTWTVALTIAGAGDSSATDLVYDSASKAYYAALSGVGIFKSSNQGTTWVPTASPFAGGVPANTVIAGVTEFSRGSLAVRNGVVYALIADSAGNPAVPTSCTSSNTPNCDTGLVQSADGGATWTSIAMPPSGAAGGQTNLYCEPTSCQGDYDQLIAAPPAGGALSLVIGGLDAWGTDNVNGLSTTWTDLTNGYAATANGVHSDQHALAVLGPNTWFLGNDGGIWSTASGGATWANLNATLGNIQFFSTSPDQQTTGAWVGGAQDNGTSKLASGTTWNRIYVGDGGRAATNPASPQQYFLEYTYVDLLRSDNAGADMTNSEATVVDSTAIPDASAFYVPYQVMPASPSNIILGTCAVWVGPGVPTSSGAGWGYNSPDLTTGGSGFNTCANNGKYITDLAGAASDANTVWAVTDDDQVQFTSNFLTATPPATWTNAAKAPLPSSINTPFSSVAVNPINPKTAYVGVQGFGSGHVFKTTDSGNTWTDITGNLPDAPVNWILIDPLGPNNDIYVASDVGVFVATDGGVQGEQWEQVAGGLPNNAVLQLALSPASWTEPRQLAAATHGRGMWTVAPLPTPDFTLSVAPASQTILNGTAATLTVTATGTNGEAGPINYSCTAPASGCGVSPTSAAPGAPVTVTLAASAVTIGANSVVITAANEANTTHTITAAVTGVPFTLSAAPTAQSVLAGAGATFTVTAAGGSGFSGSIALSCTTPASGCTVSPASVAAGGAATVTVAASQLSPGADTVTVSGSSGNATEMVNSTITVQDFAIAAPNSSASVSPGQSATYALTITSQGGFAGTVNVACSGAPAEATCSVAPAAVTPSTAGAAATVTVTTTAKSVLVPIGGPGSSGGTSLWLLLLISVGAGLACLRVRRRGSPHPAFARGLLWTAVLGIALLASGCGGGGSSSPAPPPASNPGTPAGAYTLTVTATSGSLVHSVALSMTVQ